MDVVLRPDEISDVVCHAGSCSCIGVPPSRLVVPYAKGLGSGKGLERRSCTESLGLFFDFGRVSRMDGSGLTVVLRRSHVRRA